MRLSVRLHDAVDPESVLRRVLPALAGERGERRVAFAEYDPGTETLVRRWSTRGDGSEALDEAEVSLEPARIHPLLADDVQGERPLRPADDAAVWVLRDLFPLLEVEKVRVHARAVAQDGRWLGVLVVVSPRRWWAGGGAEEGMDAGADVLELCLARAHALAGAEPRPRIGAALETAERLREREREAAETREALERARRRAASLEEAAANATEMLMEAHVELDRRSTRVRQQTRLLFLLRKLLEGDASALPAEELAGQIVRTVSEAFGGDRCSILLLNEGDAGAELRLGAAVGLPDGVERARVRMALGDGIAGRVAHSRTAVVVREPDEARDHPLVRDDAYTGSAFVSLPLVCRGRVLGVLNLTNFEEGTIDNVALEQLRLVGLCVALLIDHARLADRLFGGVPG